MDIHIAHDKIRGWLDGLLARQKQFVKWMVSRPERDGVCLWQACSKRQLCLFPSVDNYGGNILKPSKGLRTKYYKLYISSSCYNKWFIFTLQVLVISMEIPIPKRGGASQFSHHCFYYWDCLRKGDVTGKRNLSVILRLHFDPPSSAEQSVETQAVG